ncbi:hypothetical protein Sste5346_005045 [Sporothrix stenoceras]|uniref:Carboxylesterase type B domain-containing protein n=1 Tax=Sporothrix stenoceras TaxID=5173 RepID=A0ABR3Z782_9PEZI
MTATSTDAVVRLVTPLGAISARWEETDTSEGVLKVLGVQYADIPYRWAAPRKLSSNANAPWTGTHDCTQYGPGCPQIGRALFGVQKVPMFGQLGTDAGGNATMDIRPDREDEFACLNLNIYTPAGREAGGETAFLKSGRRLPVLVWIHGGSYQVGAGSVDAYDGTELVRRGLATDTPVVVVTINYRLGVLGFLHSKELADGEAEKGDVPPQFRSTGNLALVDCKYALDWLKENIHHFCGDPDNITAVGESAGAGAIHHLMTVPQLFVDVPRIILSSSTFMSIQLLRADEAQRAFDAICQKLGVTGTSSTDIVHQLRDLPVDRLVEESWFMSTTFRPIWDDITITEDPREVAFDPTRWNPSLKSIILGTCHNEPWIREAAIIAGNKKHDLSTIIKTRVPPDTDTTGTGKLRERAAQLYVDPATFPWHATLPKLAVPDRNHVSMALEGHCRYNAPATLFSRSFTQASPASPTSPTEKTLYRYVFGYATEHWPKEWPVTHTADILPMFLHRGLNAADRQVSETFADRLLQFAAGAAPHQWTPYTAGAPLLNMLDHNGGWSVSTEAEGAFDLTEECIQFWADVLKAILATGRTGWPEMAR